MAYPMGEAKWVPLRVNFDRRLKLEFHGSDISSNGGLLPYRELHHALELPPAAAPALTRLGAQADLLRQRAPLGRIFRRHHGVVRRQVRSAGTQWCIDISAMSANVSHASFR